MRKREADQPRKVYEAEVETVSVVADSNEQADLVRTVWAPPWSKGVASTQRVTSVPGRSGDLLMGKRDKAYKAEER